MPHSHAHGPRREGAQFTDPLTSERTERAIWIVVGACLLATVIGLVVLWPRGESSSSDPAVLGGATLEARVSQATPQPCSYDPSVECLSLLIELTEGVDSGTTFTLEHSTSNAGRQLETGDDIVVTADRSSDGTMLYSFYDYQRSTPLLLLGLLFVVAVVVLGRWRGVGAIGGLLASLLVLVAFMLPSLLRGNNAVAVALVGSAAIAFIALYLAHGVNVATSVALLSTFAALTITGVFAWIFVEAASFTGYTDDSTRFLDVLGIPIDPRGILLAGIVIGSLGVLDDVTVTQVSAVWELRQARPEASARALYRRALRIGRDHISSTVNTLFLAYAGAALPLLLLFSEAAQSLGSVATREIVAVEIVRALVGSIGLVSAVPISTWLAATALTTDAGGGATSSATESSGGRIAP